MIVKQSIPTTGKPADSISSSEAYLLVIVALDPRYQTKKRENLRLYTKCNVELLDDIVYSERNPSPSPQHHHG